MTKLTTITLAACVAIGLVYTPTQAGAQAGASTRPLVYCSEGDPEGQDPALSTSGTTLDATRPVYDSLFGFAPDDLALVPRLATSWTISDDGLEYIFHLRRGVKFHSIPGFVPTRDFNAADVVFSLGRQLYDDHPYNDSDRYPGVYSYFASMSMHDILRDVIAVDDYTVKFILSRPDGAFLSNMAMDFASILSAEYAEHLLAVGTPEVLNRNPVGTGPFRLVTYRRNELIRYRAHPEYWRSQARSENLIFAITPEASVRLQRLRAGECHIMAYPNPADQESMRTDPNIVVLTREGLNTSYVAFNTLIPPFDDPTVRRALIMAIDRPTLVDRAYRGTATVARGPLPPAQWGYAAGDAIPYDPEAARALLAAAGVSGLTMRLWALPVSRPYMPDGSIVAELIQAYWAAIGVKAEIITYDWGIYLDLAAELDRDGAVTVGWSSDNGDPDNFLGMLLGCAGVGGTNLAHWCDERFEGLIRRARGLSDQNERIPFYEEAQLTAQDAAPWIPLAHATVTDAVRSDVRGYQPSPLGQHDFYEAYVTDEGAAK